MKLKVALLFLTGLLLYLGTAYWNIGFIALDGYSDVISKIIPSQSSSARHIVDTSGIRSPLPTLTLMGFSKAMLSLDIVEPANQLRGVLVLWAFLSFLIISSCTVGLFRDARDFTQSKLSVALFLVGFYFLCPLFLTRAMIESLAAPFLMASAYFACKYVRDPKFSRVVMAVVCLCCASLLRFQAGVCGGALLLTVLYMRQYKHLLGLVAVSLLAFVVTGGVDLLLRGDFHASLLSYWNYNIAHSSSYGVSPFYNYALLFLGLSLPPTFFARYRGLNWRESYGPLMPLFLYFLFFVVAHSVVPHKEERFMVTVIPLFLMLLVPMAHYLANSPEHKWRVKYFVGLNIVLLALVSINIPQNNIIGLVSFLDTHPEIEEISNVENSIVLFPRAFMRRDIQMHQVSRSGLKERDVNACNQVYAIRLDKKPVLNKVYPPLVELATFKPGFLEHLIVLANPKKNSRRGALHLYQNAHCHSSTAR